MATIQALLNDINLRYRNTFTTDQLIVWMNEEQEELFQIFELDSAPYAFTLLRDETDNPVKFYPIPDGVDIDRIKVISVQINDDPEPTFQEIHFKRNDDYISTQYEGYWYTIVENNLFIYLSSDTMYVNTRYVYIYCDTQPTVITSSNLNLEPSVPLRYQEILKLGTLKRIALARKDDVWASNYDASREEKIADMEWRMKMSEPEFVSPADANPKPIHAWYGPGGVWWGDRLW